jgi:hypothetical protein
MYPVWGYYPPPVYYYRMPYLPEHLKIYEGKKVTLFTTEGELITGFLDIGVPPYDGTLTIYLDPSPDIKYVHISKVKWIIPA